MEGYRFYMQECDKDGNPVDGTLKDLERDFAGLRYSKCEGLNAFGASKNIYTETYSDSDRVRAYVPEKVMREATDIKFTFYFFGNSAERQDSFEKFMEYINRGYHLYWDTARNRKFIFTPPKDSIEPSDEMWYGGMPYFKVVIKLQNIMGNTSKVQ